MLYLLGGPPRSGKTKIAERFCRERGLGWLSMDIVRSLARSLSTDLAAVDVGIDSDPVPEAEAMRPSFELVARISAQLAEGYLVEGVGFMPSQVVGLPDWIERRACFVGLSTVTLEDIETHSGRNDWHRALSDADASRLPGWIERWSSAVERECHDYGMPYVDLADDWDGGAVLVSKILDGVRRPAIREQRAGH